MATKFVLFQKLDPANLWLSDIPKRGKTAQIQIHRIIQVFDDTVTWFRKKKCEDKLRTMRKNSEGLSSQVPFSKFQSSKFVFIILPSFSDILNSLKAYKIYISLHRDFLPEEQARPPWWGLQRPRKPQRTVCFTGETSSGIRKSFKSTSLGMLFQTNNSI